MDDDPIDALDAGVTAYRELLDEIALELDAIATAPLPGDMIEQIELLDRLSDPEPPAPLYPLRDQV